MSPVEIKTALVAKAKSLGFDDCRIAPARPAAHRELFEQWIAEGKHGDMAWMARNLERRSDPRIVLPGARSVIVMALNYRERILIVGILVSLFCKISPVCLR